MKSMRFGAFAALTGLLLGCTGNISTNGPDGQPPTTPGSGASTATGGTGSGGTSPGSGGTGTGGTDPGSGGTGTGGAGAETATGGTGGTAIANPEDPLLPFEPVDVRAQLRKVKGLLTGLAPTEEEVTLVTSAPDQKEALKGLIDTWTSKDHPEFYQFFYDKMLVFFTNTFQQTGFTPTEDFKPQLLENGGFDLGPIGVFGDDAFPKLVQNLQQSFARTALHLIETDQPFTNVLTTRELMMTTALMSLYIQVEMPNDQPFNFRGGQNEEKLQWQLDMTGVGTGEMPTPTDADRVSPEHPIEEAVTTMLFDDRAPVMGGASFNFGNGTCVPEIKMQESYTTLFQRLFGYTQRTPFAANIECIEHGSLPYYTAQDLSDWRPVTLTAGADHPEMYDLPALRQTSTMGLAMPRVGFFTTPAYLAIWQTNDSNKHRVTANQTLLVSLGQALTSENEIAPVSTVGLDAEHSPDSNPECYGCHKILDPMKQFWESYFDFSDRNDFPTFRFGQSNVTPQRTNGGALMFGNVAAEGATMEDLGGLLAQVSDTNPSVADAALQTVNRFALSMAQYLCYYADSAGCAEDDPEFRRIVKAFETSNFDYKVLLREMFSSPLVTGSAHTLTFDRRNVVVSIARKDQLCQELSNRLGIPDLCALGVAFPYSSGFGGTGQQTGVAAQRSIFRIAGSMPADGFSRGSEQPVALADPTLFYRAASELICETVAVRSVDVDGAPYTSSNVAASIAGMVQTIVGYSTGDPKYASAVQILTDHYNEVAADNSATAAMQSTFSLACQSPTSVSFGL
jgi:hypothetical protein